MWRKFRIFESVILRKKRHDLNVWFITSNFWIPVWWYNITDYFIVFQRGIWGIGCCCFTNFIRCTDKQKQQGQLCVLTFFGGLGVPSMLPLAPGSWRYRISFLGRHLFLFWAFLMNLLVILLSQLVVLVWTDRLLPLKINISKEVVVTVVVIL